MSNAWCDKKMPRLSLGDEMIDGWIDGLVSTVERNSNVTATGGIQARVGPNGIALSLVGDGLIKIAKSGGSGIPAMSGTTAGSGTVTLYDLAGATGTTVATQAVTVTALNLASTAVGNNKMIGLVKYDKFWVVFCEWC